MGTAPVKFKVGLLAGQPRQEAAASAGVIRASATLILRYRTHDLINVLTATGPGNLAALTAGNCRTHRDSLKW